MRGTDHAELLVSSLQLPRHSFNKIRTARDVPGHRSKPSGQGIAVILKDSDTFGHLAEGAPNVTGWGG